jgi:LmbE family N-acetylglucosaminyl deacetylase
MRAAVVVACTLAACGDNALPDGLPLTAAHDVAIVAHQDDDLLFMQPDLVEAVRGGAGVVSLYVTAGNGTHGLAEADRRYAGLRDAYATAAGDSHWRCGWIELAGHAAEHCRLQSANVSLVFLGYPDGGKQGEKPDSLLHLWQGAIPGAFTIAGRPAYYDRGALIETVAEVIRETQPATVHTVEVAATHGYDHSDHMIVGALALLAVGSANSMAELRSYRGYSVDPEPANKADAIYGDLLALLARYEACYAGCAPCGQACSAATIDPQHEIWLQRRYAVGFRRSVAGVVHGAGGCLLLDGTTGDCASAPVWRLDAYGELRAGDACLLASGGTGTCTGGPDRRWFVDDEGHVWSALPPDAASVADYDHLACLGAPICGADSAPTWDFAPAIRSTARSALALSSTGRALRIADLTGDGKGDLCAVEGGALMCATGDGAGGFGGAMRIDLPSAPLAIDPRSLALGDIDGDGRADACGISLADGNVMCATASHAFAAATWSRINAVAGTAASLAVAGGQLCGLSAQGVACTTRTQTVQLSTWPAPDATVWFGDLDGDGAIDWCSGASCGVAAELALTSDGVPWSWSLGGAVDPAPSDDTGGLADVDGDGRADLCSVSAAGVACARSQGRGFGPLATLASPLAGSALVLGDLDGDGKADACVDTGGAIACALSP